MPSAIRVPSIKVAVMTIPHSLLDADHHTLQRRVRDPINSQFPISNSHPRGRGRPFPIRSDEHWELRIGNWSDFLFRWYVGSTMSTGFTERLRAAAEVLESIANNRGLLAD